jgi:hypothetical protein
MVRPDGKPATLDPAETLTVDSKGGIHQNGQEVARLVMAEMDAASKLMKQGQTYFRLEGPNPKLSASGEVHQGVLEGANVPVAEAAVRLVSVMRQFEMLQRIRPFERAAPGRTASARSGRGTEEVDSERAGISSGHKYLASVASRSQHTDTASPGSLFSASAAQVIEAVNRRFGAGKDGVARAENAGLVVVNVPAAYAQKRVEFVAEVESIPVETDLPARSLSTNAREPSWSGKTSGLSPPRSCLAL